MRRPPTAFPVPLEGRFRGDRSSICFEVLTGRSLYPRDGALIAGRGVHPSAAIPVKTVRAFSSRWPSTAPWIPPLFEIFAAPLRFGVGWRPGFHFGEEGRLS